MAKQLTLKNIEHFTLQQVFDKVAKHLLKQRAQALSDANACQYRVVKNGKVFTCAVGCLIPRRDYDSIMEGKRVGALISNENFNFPRKFLLEDNLEYLKLLRNLQNIHDASPVALWDSNLQSLAQKFGLEWIY
jgi:hypothetical protein